ncbi:MAG: type II secretion system ATPase GspE [Deltaproteobacteria bacterium]|nr:type II secretion system ATPase GspE [Deltaproteobacteria bacterium]
MDILVDEGWLEELALLEALGKTFAMPVLKKIDVDAIDPELAVQIPIAFAKANGLLPLRRDDDAIYVALSNPFDTAPLDDLHLLFRGSRVVPTLASRREILNSINEVYDRSGVDSASELAEDAVTDLNALASEISQEPEDLLESADEAPVIRLVNSLLQEAIKERASDVHIEPFEKEIRVRFRVDDILYEPMKPLPRSLQSSIVSRVKIMGNLNIAEKRLPQDGRIRLKIAGKDYDVRLSTVPIAHGERVVMRLLPRTQELLDLAKIGFNPKQLKVMHRLIARPNGIILVTGPTGSGKTTTLYSALAGINTEDKNILTVEDPVEIQLEGVGQIEVNPKVGLTFSSGLRSILRQDPNIVLIGEIRDLETAEIAIQASLTGHLVFSTLHTNDAPGAITRLVDMGVEPFLVGSSLVAVVAQRLVRVLCPACKKAHQATPEELAEIGVRTQQQVQIYQPEGCPECNHTGYRGRKGIFELMLVDDDIRTLITQSADSKTIKKKAMAKGMSSLRADGARKVLQGITSIAEVIRATEEESVVEQI